MDTTRNKYRKGSTIFSWTELMYSHLTKGRWVYLRDKVVHPSFILHMTLETVQKLLEANQICGAIDQTRERYASWG